MISDSQLEELRAYRAAERRLTLTQDPSFSDLVIAGSNERYPVHRWFRFKESFSADLLKTVLAEVLSPGTRRIRLLDPFCGVGTSLVASQELAAHGLDIEAAGIERNPFIAFCARAKVRWPAIDARRLGPLGEAALEQSDELNARIPPLSSLADGCISRETARRILKIRDAICGHGDDPTHNALLVGLAASIEPSSWVRKDGRMLRLIDRRAAPLMRTLRSRWSDIEADVDFMKQVIETCRVPTVTLGDGRRPLSHGVAPGSVDVILTSPPYPNAIDYSEVYKLELWLLRFVSTPQEFLTLRHSTLRSHPTVEDAELSEDLQAALKHHDLGTLLKPLLRKTKRLPKRWRHRMVLGYVADIWNALREYEQCLRPGGVCVLVVGNSLHGGPSLPYLIPTDLLVLEAARAIGLEPTKSIVARGLKRRLSGNHFLRESVLVLRKTKR